MVEAGTLAHRAKGDGKQLTGKPLVQRAMQIWTCCGHLVVHDRAEAPDVRTLRKASSDDIEQFRNVLDAKADDYGLRTGDPPCRQG